MNPRRRLIQSVASASVVLLSLLLSACGAFCDYDIRQQLNHYATRGSHKNPDSVVYDRWVASPYLAERAAEGIEAEGLEAFASKHGLQCRFSARGDCPDCRACDRTNLFMGNAMWGLRSECISFGEMRIHLDIGPGRAVSAMTYWKRP